MNIKEKDLEEIIFEADNETLNRKGFFINEGKKYRQLRIGSYGVADLVIVSRQYHTDFVYDRKQRGFVPAEIPELKIDIVEIKKDKAGIGAFLQAVRYAKGIKQYMLQRNFSNRFSLGIILLAPKIDTDGSLIFLNDLIYSEEKGYISSINMYSVFYGIDGPTFTSEDSYKLTDENF